jgi:hypothetical protein
VAAAAKPGLYGDGGNLYLQIGPEGGKSWSCRFMLRGRQRQTGLGPVDLVSLAEARDLARDYRRLLLQGIDPIEHRRGQRQAASTAVSRVVTFRHCAERYIAAHEVGWRTRSTASNGRRASRPTLIR